MADGEKKDLLPMLYVVLMRLFIKSIKVYYSERTDVKLDQSVIPEVYSVAVCDTSLNNKGKVFWRRLRH